MRILFFTHTFNSLAQRLHVELTARGHAVSIELDISDDVSLEAVKLFKPDLIIAPFLKRAIPEALWREHVCLVVHPGIIGDRGPSSLDWAILEGEREWGVTVLQANEVMDGGDIWASRTFPMRAARKSSLYRNEVTEAATAAVLEAVEKFEKGGFTPRPLNYSDPDVRGKLHPTIKQVCRAIHWETDSTADILRKVRAADSTPGVLDRILGQEFYLYDAWEEGALECPEGEAPGTILAQRNGAICRATIDGAVWLTHLKRKSDSEPAFKLPAVQALGELMPAVPEIACDPFATTDVPTWRDIAYEERNGVGYLHFPFYNGAMGTKQCQRLRETLERAKSRDTRVLVLMGGPDFWSNGIHLNLIEAASSPADESWENINAMNDLVREILTTDSKLTISAIQGNAGAGGVFLALAADKVYARQGVVLNPHYKSMGNLFGSEYWTYLLPKRVGDDRARAITQNRLPIGAATAREMGLVDGAYGHDGASFVAEIEKIAEFWAQNPELPAVLARKRALRAEDEARKPLEQYRAEELARMKLNFYGFDPSYHVARYNFVFRVPHSWTPLHLARHRRDFWVARGILETSS